MLKGRSSRRHIAIKTAFTFGGEGRTFLKLGVPLFLTTMCTLLLEIALTRIFSVVLFYHYAFLVISIALLGLAVGAIVARFVPDHWSPEQRHASLSGASLLTALAIVPVLGQILNTNIWLVDSLSTIMTISQLYLLCLIPFALSGFIISSVMSVGGHKIPVLYFYDLLGGALGCLLFIPIIEAVGGPNTILLIAVLWAVAAMAWAYSSGFATLLVASGITVVALFGLWMANLQHAFFDVQYMRGQPMKNEVFAKWNSFSRISVYKTDTNEHWIEIDGGAGTWIPGGVKDEAYLSQLRTRFGQAGAELALALHPQPDTLIIGIGGGFDIQRALVARSPNVTAVEINPIIANDVMKSDFYYALSDGIYGCREGRPDTDCRHPNVHLHIEDGRTFVQRSKERYDVILLSQVDTWASTASGSYGLTETYLYTVDAIKAYFDHLTENGIVSISRWEFKKPRETLRLVANGLEALEQRGIAHPEEHLAVVLEGKVNAEDNVYFGTMLIKKTPFTAEDIAGIQTLSERSPVMKIAYAPGVEAGNPVYHDLILAPSRQAFFDRYEYDVTPVTDQRPFFFFTDRWSHFFKGLYQYTSSGDTVSSSAQHILTVLFLLSLLAVSLFIILPLRLFPKHFPASRQMLPNLLFCLCVGLGYIIVEISMIHKFVIYLGQPVYSLTVVIFAFLVSSGFGSAISQRYLPEELKPRLSRLLPLIIVLGAVYTQIVPLMTHATLAWPILFKILMVLLLTAPLGLIMGMPFPSVLRLTSMVHHRGIEWSWALNAAGTVMGSVATIFIAVHLGMTAAMLAGVFAYALALVSLRYITSRPLS